MKANEGLDRPRRRGVCAVWPVSCRPAACACARLAPRPTGNAGTADKRPRELLGPHGAGGGLFNQPPPGDNGSQPGSYLASGRAAVCVRDAAEPFSGTFRAPCSSPVLQLKASVALLPPAVLCPCSRCSRATRQTNPAVTSRSCRRLWSERLAVK